MPNKFSWKKLEKPFVCLAPMAGYTDSAYRQIVKGIAPKTICYSELTSINALEHGSKKTEKMLEIQPVEHPIIMQLFGNDPDYFVQASKKLEKAGADGIDINMGCPAPKITKSCYGSAILKDPALAGRIVEALSKSTSLPISVKMRIGYSKYEEKHFVKIIETIQKAGASAITIHGRTTSQAYSGEADFEPIYLAKSILKIPVIGNGDIDSPEKAVQRLTSPDGKITLDGLMIGRASIGNPWLLQEIFSSKPQPEKTFKQKLPTIKRHLSLAIKLYGERGGLLEMRKHLAGYIHGIPNASKYRQKIMQSESQKDVLKTLSEIAKEIA
ncbi:tRNA dihydrouridine synthase DusB [Candidatus Peregrinibacteria bacterium]|jgi:tRNA-dihydrouridine synthase B|nr:tRNA dihydrouridine synthase DusB [Candidatus Peregrinibacteria bacterium]MBT4148408.1 tRNA dihydrouridine synthase DusB [Candidatus Peregrinibacteria bacterium]MBT4366467.1 tRNA dihydrouridine synthase DusB [Candidatus Peregrinibacteria bacterium]MBT4456082.1 tRNA dihydrouridine synthase DusB [Candidatus Peregrinibacteria bacterium]